MAFCPNCGTPNTDQAEKCVSCAFELAPKQKAKFKGTIMMSGVQAPTGPGQPGVAPPPAAQQPPPGPAVFTPASHAPVQAAPPGPKNLGFEKTMMGPMAVPPGTGLPQTPSPTQPAQPSAADFGRAATVEQQAPQFQQPPVQAPPPSFSQPPAAPANFSSGAASGSGAAAGGFSSGGASGSGAGYTGTGGGFNTTSDLPMPPKSNTGKMIAIGCAGLLLLGCVIGGVLFFVAKNKFNALKDTIESEGPTLEWRTRVAQSLENVLEICKTDCKGAAVYFHPQLEAELMTQAKGLSHNGLVKLVDPTQSEARMLDGTDDSGLATKLNLDPLQCVRITSGSAKVIGCSVPDPSGNSSLRIVHLEGASSL